MFWSVVYLVLLVLVRKLLQENHKVRVVDIKLFELRFSNKPASQGKIPSKGNERFRKFCADKILWKRRTGLAKLHIHIHNGFLARLYVHSNRPYRMLENLGWKISF